ncbi:hypothetical protein FKM82_010481 [Ascaphus truei]
MTFVGYIMRGHSSGNPFNARGCPFGTGRVNTSCEPQKKGNHCVQLQHTSETGLWVSPIAHCAVDTAGLIPTCSYTSPKT